MKCLCDENIPKPIVDALRLAGHTVAYVAETSASIDDQEVLTEAVRDGALLITSDRDFGLLVFGQHRPSGGVLLLRLANVSHRARANEVLAALATHGPQLAASFTVLSPGGFLRHRPLPDP